MDDTWEFGPELTPYPDGVSSHCLTPLTLDKDEDIFVFIGGMSQTASGHSVTFSTVNSYNFKTGTWLALADLPQQTQLATCAPFTTQAGDDIILVAGRLMQLQEILNSI